MYEEETAYEEESQEQGSSQQEKKEPEVKPVNFGKRTVGFILVGVLILVFVLLMVFDRISLTKKAESHNPPSEEQTMESSTNIDISSNVDESLSTSEEISGSLEESSSAPSEVTESTESGVSESSELEKSESVSVSEEATVAPSILEVQDEPIEVSNQFSIVDPIPAMGAEVTTSGMVSGMGMYKIGNSYTYGINIILVTGNDVKVECSYFCPKNTYSALGIGDALTVIYQMDSQGNVSISSISK